MSYPGQVIGQLIFALSQKNLGSDWIESGRVGSANSDHLAKA